MIKVLDTTVETHKKQLEIIHSKTPKERALMGIDMIDSTYRLISNVILQKYPEISKGELTAKIFVRYYKNEFKEAELQSISKKIISAHDGR